MIASDYLRCSPTDVAARDRRHEILTNLSPIIFKTVRKLLEDSGVVTEQDACWRIANTVLDHMMLSCYSPANGPWRG